MEVSLVDELACVFSNADSARLVVNRAGFPAAQCPAFSSPSVFWDHIHTMCRNGMFSFEKIVNEACRQMPHNPVFKKAASRLKSVIAEVSPHPSLSPLSSVKTIYDLDKPAFDALNKALSTWNNVSVPTKNGSKIVTIFHLAGRAFDWLRVSPTATQHAIRSEISQNVGPEEDGFSGGSKPSPLNRPLCERWNRIEEGKDLYVRAVHALTSVLPNSMDFGALTPTKLTHTEEERWRLTETQYRELATRNDSLRLLVCVLEEHTRMIADVASVPSAVVMQLTSLLASCVRTMSDALVLVDETIGSSKTNRAEGKSLADWL